MSENTQEKLTRDMQPWGFVRQRLRAAREALKDAGDRVVIWAEPKDGDGATVVNYEVKTIRAEHFTGAHPKAIWE